MNKKIKLCPLGVKFEPDEEFGCTANQSEKVKMNPGFVPLELFSNFVNGEFNPDSENEKPILISDICNICNKVYEKVNLEN